MPFILFVPENESGKAVIYLHPEGKAAEASESGEIEWFVKKGYHGSGSRPAGHVGELGGM
jgi:hypothetical protein